MATSDLASLPSVDRLMSTALGRSLAASHGRDPLKHAIRDTLAEIRDRHHKSGIDAMPDADAILALVADQLAESHRPSLRVVYNLTGTVLHTNLGRAPLPPEAIERIAEVAAAPSNLEFNLETGKRGDRDVHIESLLTEITGAEAATVINNNAAAVLLTLNTFASGREVIVSRGELVEIGGSFRIPEIMVRANCRLREVGATNRTHLKDFEQAIGESTGLIMKVHTSNYEIQGFTHEVDPADLAATARAAGVPFVNDLGSGTLVDLTRYGLPREPTVQQALAGGADLVTFSGDKLLGGPQAGMVVGRADLIEQIKRNPMKRAMRVDKMTLAGLYEVLKLYRDPERLPERLPTLRLLTRSPEAIRATAETAAPLVQRALAGRAEVTVEPCQGQIGSGALPTEILPGYCLSISPIEAGDRHVRAIAAALRALPVPVIGRVNDGKILLDMRTVEETSSFTSQFANLDLR